MFFQLTKTSSICSTLTHRNARQWKRSVHTGLRVCVVAADQHGLWQVLTALVMRKWFVASPGIVLQPYHLSTVSLFRAL